MKKINQFFKNHYYLAAALLMFLSFPSYDFVLLKFFPFFAWVFLIPLLVYLAGRPLKDVFFTVFITGLAGNLFTYGWIGNFGAKVPGGYAVILLFLIPSLTAFFTIKIFISEYLSRRFPAYKIMIYPSVWIIIDYVQSIGFLAFPWTYIGYSQYPFVPFIQAASVIGILGINFIIIMFNTVLSEYILAFKSMPSGVRDFRNNSYIRSVVSVSLIVVLITIAGFMRLSHTPDNGSGRTLRVALVQSCISPWENWSGNRFRYLAELMHYTKESLSSNPDLIIWSESATLELISFRSLTGEIDRFDHHLKSFIKETGKPLLTGEIGLTVKKTDKGMRYFPQNNAVLIGGDGEVVKTYPKINLVPFGEWFPYDKWFVPVKRLVESFGGSDFVPGSRPELFKVDELKFGSLICYEGIFYRLCREYRNMGADFLVNITNDGWTDAYNGHYQHYSASVFRAVENGIWMVRAGNTGVTSIIDPRGRPVRSVPILKKTFLTGEIDTSQNVNTLYTKYGDVLLYLSMLFIASILINLTVKFFRSRRGQI
ncbi:MAG: apolipoprotein N-acyltransferase [Spirochaetae bacterium HGW-Spirochaetae-5]|nr:MAG: apolipoprotein N-acyltransferase [Spirochaetae bacterium HGW-Spirochaetae-5]